ncbi:hypothetical protein Tco_0205348 [Tanacetum coccineum]
MQNSSRAAVSVNTARPINTAYPRPIVNCVRPISNVFNRAHSHVRRPFNKFTTNKNSNFNERVNNVRPTAVVSDNKGNKANAVKALACWVWIPKLKVLDHGNPQLELQEKGVIDSGCSRHMTRNMSYLSDYEEIDGGYVSFEGDPKGGKITGKGKIKTGKLDFKYVYFVKELKFNLFNVSQMCDKKNNVLFTDTECVVFSSDFKLLDESQVLLRVPRKDNMYNVDLRNVVPQGGKARVGSTKDYILLPFLTQDLLFSSSSKDSHDAGFKPSREEEKKDAKAPENEDSEVINTEEPRVNQEKDENVNSTNNINTVSSTVNTASIEDNDVDENIVYGCADDPNMPNLEETDYSNDDEGVGVKADMNNLDTFMPVSPIPTTRIHKDHPVEHIH